MLAIFVSLVIAAAMAAAGNVADTRSQLIGLCVYLWAVRLGSFLFLRVQQERARFGAIQAIVVASSAQASGPGRVTQTISARSYSGQELPSQLSLFSPGPQWQRSSLPCSSMC